LQPFLLTYLEADLSL